MRLLRLLYNLCFPVVLLALLPSFVLRMVRRGNYRHKFGQRFGIYSRRVQDKLAGKRWTWIHAVSVGEVMIALKLIDGLRERWPEVNVVLSTTTSTGYRLAHRHKSVSLEPVYHPLDFPPFVKRAFRAFRPERILLVEAEIWPNVMAEAMRRNIPRILVNARLSKRSEARYRAVRWLAAPLFNSLNALCLQEPGEVARWRSLGVNEEKLHVTGSIKFDSAVPTRTLRDFRPILEEAGVRGPILLGGSTFDGEELLLAQAARQLREEFPDLFLILVPRHAERGRRVAAQLADAGFSVRLRSEPANGSAEILLVNSTGELRDWFACADVVFMGKSLALSAKGGQNPAEAIVAGKPVLFGPHMQNFAGLVRQLLVAGGAREVGSKGEMVSAVAHLLNHPEEVERMVVSAAACLDVHRGATARTVETIAS